MPIDNTILKGIESSFPTSIKTGQLSINSKTGVISVYDGNTHLPITNNNDIGPSLNQIYFQERIKDLFLFCIYKKDNIFKICLFEINDDNNNDLNEKLITDNLNDVIKNLKDNLSIEEFQEYERQIFKYF